MPCETTKTTYDLSSFEKLARTFGLTIIPLGGTMEGGFMVLRNDPAPPWHCIHNPETGHFSFTFDQLIHYLLKERRDP